MAKAISEKIRNEMIEKYLSGMSSEKIAKEYGSKAQTVTKFIKEAGYEVRGPQSKLTEEQKDEVVRLYKEEHIGGTILARRFGVTPIIINKILHKKGVEVRSYADCHKIGV